MSKTKLPRDIQQQCLWIVRGYERNKRDYNERRREILDGSGQHFTEYKAANGEIRRALMPGSHNASRTTEDKQMQLEGLEHTMAFKQMKAVEHAHDRIGAGLPVTLRGMLQKAIMMNCQNGRAYPYERLFTVGVSRASFYRYREAFFWDIANELGII